MLKRMKTSGMPPHFIIEKEKEVVFLIRGGFPATFALGNYMKNFPEGWKGSIIRCEESFYKMRMKSNRAKH